MNMESSAETQPPSKKQRLDTATYSTPSFFDSKVLESCAEGGLVEAVAPRPLTDMEMFTLLIAILSNDKDLQDASTVPKFMHKHPELRPHLQDAWESKKFEKIRRLPFLQAPRQDQGGNAHQGHTPGTVSKRITALAYIEKAWELPYQRKAHEVLYKSICEMWAPDATPYQNIVAVLQSSGYGKTRMLDEHAKFVFTFPFVVRDPSETRVGSAYPYPDQRVRTFLTTFGKSEIKAMAGYYKFFASLFGRALTIIKESYCGPEPLPDWWRKYLAIPENRDKLYSLAIDLAEPTLTEGDNEQSKPKERAGGEELSNAVKELLNVISTPGLKKEAGHQVKVVIYFDEAHELCKHDAEPGSKRNRLEVLYDCLDVFLPFPLMFIFTSTTSSLHRLASTRDASYSTRRVVGKSVDQAPITELPFDCHRSFPLKPHECSFEDICELKFLARFGRPLFWSLLESGENEYTVLTLAKDKLAPDDSGTVYQAPKLGMTPTYSWTAIIDVLLMLDYNPDHKTVQNLQKRLVAGHMRTCISIPSNREFMRSCYPSEPFLAEAAMVMLTKELHPNVDSTLQDRVIDTVNDYFSQGLLHPGDLGELTARMLLMNAYMSGCKKSGNEIYSKGCKLNEFLRCLFREFDIVLEAKPDNVFDGPTLKDAFEDAVVRFTHFGKFVDDTATSRDAAHAAFFRSMAIVCHDTQVSVDIIVPVLHTTKGVVCRHVITSILIQVKRRIRPGNPRLLAIDQAKVGFFPKDTLCECGRQQRNTELELPYINFVLDLGVRARPASTQAAAPPKRRSLRKQPPKHNRYTIYARGLTSFGSVTEQNLSKYERLLRLSNVLGDHPRQSPSHLEMVRTLKRFWARGDAFDWIENELNGRPLPTEEGDALEVGQYESEDDT
ncbi:hypothetical protein M378DRAFT_13970 [Amanita muscaria Koide BX008]|uniref:Uncharacterized protein n=1 Tax=Amanita muscaria (strain Koide BX008) TaxID=946122 RepID=A0A0C2WV98_AMAMK|nr:hypothetical protein M378DRAFT_13970 [Amanita muscaria Koide BX008]